MASGSIRARIQRLEEIVRPPKPPKAMRLATMQAPLPDASARERKAFRSQVAQALERHDRVIVVGDVDEQLLSLPGGDRLAFVGTELEAVLERLSLTPSARGGASALEDLLRGLGGNVIGPRPSAAFHGDDPDDGGEEDDEG